MLDDIITWGNYMIIFVEFILFANIFGFVAKKSNRIADSCSDQKKITKAGVFFEKALPKDSLIMKKHKIALLFYTLLFLLLAPIVLIQTIGIFFMYLVLGIHCLRLITQITVLIILIRTQGDEGSV